MTSFSWYRDDDHPWVRSLKFVDINVDELFARAVQLQKPSSKRRAWVLDLDSTLFCVGPRVRNIFFEFLRAHPSPPLLWARLIPRLDVQFLRYDLEATFAACLAPIMESELAAKAEAQSLWAEFSPFFHAHFFVDRHLHHDLPYPGAIDFVRRIRALGDVVVYLTGRDRPRSGLGTLHSIRTSGLGFGPEDILLMKPRREEIDVEFKARASSTLRSQFFVPVIVDNEPENLVMFAREFPDAEVVLFHSVMSARVPAHDFRQALGARDPLRLLTF